MSEAGRLPERVAVSGGAGFIGSHTVELLDAAGVQVLVIDDHSHACGHALPKSVAQVRADVASPEAARALREFGPAAVLHLATKGGVVRSLRDPVDHLRLSLLNSVGFFRSCVEAGVRSIVAASSGGTIYGATEHLPAGEDEPVQPVSPYGASKAAEEVYLHSLGRLAEVRTLSLRYGNVYGPRQDGSGEAGLVAITSSRILEDLPPTIYGDGRQTRDFVFVLDVARANLAALGSQYRGALNIGTGREASVREVVETLQRLSGARSQPVYGPARPAEVRRVCLDPSRARSLLGWSAQIEVGEGLARTFAYFQAAAAAAGVKA